MRLKSFLHDIQYERIETTVRPEFICKHSIFYVSQGAMIAFSILFSSLMAFGGVGDRELKCDDLDAQDSFEA